MEIEEYLVKKDKTDLMSSLQALDKMIIKKSLEHYGLDNIEELKEYIIDDFKYCLESSKDDIFTQLYFHKLINNENSIWMSAYDMDIESLWVFMYDNGKSYSYYIADEIKEIINNTFNW